MAPLFRNPVRLILRRNSTAKCVCMSLLLKTQKQHLNCMIDQGHFMSTRNNNTAQQSLYFDFGTNCFKNTDLSSGFVK